MTYSVLQYQVTFLSSAELLAGITGAGISIPATFLLRGSSQTPFQYSFPTETHKTYPGANSVCTVINPVRNAEIRFGLLQNNNGNIFELFCAIYDISIGKEGLFLPCVPFKSVIVVNLETSKTATFTNVSIKRPSDITVKSTDPTDIIIECCAEQSLIMG